MFILQTPYPWPLGPSHRDSITLCSKPFPTPHGSTFIHKTSSTEHQRNGFRTIPRYHPVSENFNAQNAKVKYIKADHPPRILHLNNTSGVLSDSVLRHDIVAYPLLAAANADIGSQCRYSGLSASDWSSLCASPSTSGDLLYYRGRRRSDHRWRCESGVKG